MPPSDDGPAVVAAPEDPALDSTTTSTVPSSTTTIRDSTTTTVRPTETTVTDRPSTTLVDDRIDTITSVPITVVGPTETTVVDSATTSSTTSTSTTTTTLADKDEPPEIETYRVSGYVHAGPVCPVEQFPPDPDCEDFAVRGAVMVITTGDGKQVARVETDGNGRFRTELPNGRYTITPQPVPGLLGTASPQNFAVDGARVQLDIAYDTGIR